MPNNTEPVKNPLASLINWTAVVTTCIGILSMPEFQSIIPLKWMPYIVCAIGVLNLIVRNFFTSKPTTGFAARMDR